MEPIRKSFAIPSDNEEINAISICLELLNGLSEDERRRVITYISSWVNDTKEDLGKTK